jgi:hypothetical protein
MLLRRSMTAPRLTEGHNLNRVAGRQATEPKRAMLIFHTKQNHPTWTHTTLRLAQGGWLPSTFAGSVNDLGVLLGVEGVVDGAAVVVDEDVLLELSPPVLGLDSVFDSEAELGVAMSAATLLPPLASFALAEELYKSEYQPPPLSKKPVPPEIWRLAFLAPHEAQVSRAGSEIRCATSQLCPQPSHKYSYVGMASTKVCRLNCEPTCSNVGSQVCPRGKDVKVPTWLALHFANQ